MRPEVGSRFVGSREEPSEVPLLAWGSSAGHTSHALPPGGFECQQCAPMAVEEPQMESQPGVVGHAPSSS